MSKYVKNSLCGALKAVFDDNEPLNIANTPYLISI
jgi:hypothetical protein